MRVLLWVLVALNLGALVYFNLDLIAPPQVSATKPDIQPEKMKMLTPKRWRPCQHVKKCQQRQLLIQLRQ